MIRELRLVKIVVPLVWVGFVAAISFMEAWLKFTAPGVTLTVGLSIGKIVFGALNRVEIFFSALLAVVLMAQRKVSWSAEPFYFVPASIVVVQSLWMLPFLSERVAIYQSGQVPPPSDMHMYFIVLEVIKVVCLLLYGLKQLTEWKM